MSDQTNFRAVRVLAGLILVGLLIGIASILWSDDSDPNPIRPTIGAESPPVSTSGISDSKRVDLPIDQESRREPSVAKDSQVSEPSATAGQAEDEITIHGRIETTTTSGPVTSTANGSFECNAAIANTSSTIAVVVRDGAFRFVAPKRAAGFYFTELLLDGEPAYFDDSEGIDSPLPSPLILRVHRPSPLILRVQDEATELDLTHVEIVSHSNPTQARLEIPDLATAKRIAEDVTSPFRVTKSSSNPDVITYFATAPGYAWNRLNVDPTRGGEHSIFLRPGGTLELLVLGVPPPRDVNLRIRRSDRESSQPVFDSALTTTGRLSIAGLAPGAYEIRAEVGDWFREPKVLGSAQQVIVAGATAATLLTLEPAEVSTTVPFRGKLIIPNGWNFPRIGLSIQPLKGAGMRQMLDANEFTEVSTNPRVLAFDAGSLEPTLYKIEFTPLSYTVSYELTAPGETNFVLELPEPAQVIVRLVERPTGAPAQLSDLAWKPLRPGMPRGSRFEHAAPSPDALHYEFQAPVGEIEVLVQNAKYLLRPITLDVASGSNEFTIEVDLAGGVRLFLRNGDRVVAWHEDLRAQLESLDGSRLSSSVAIGADGTCHTYSTSKPGRYRVTLEDLEGYEPIAPFEIEIPAESFVEHVIQLTPRR